MRIFIIRHGDPDYERDTLTEKGHREAALLAKRYKDEKIDYFYSSPLGRAKHTCDYLQKPISAADGYSRAITGKRRRINTIAVRQHDNRRYGKHYRQRNRGSRYRSRA